MWAELGVKIVEDGDGVKRILRLSGERDIGVSFVSVAWWIWAKEVSLEPEGLELNELVAVMGVVVRADVLLADEGTERFRDGGIPGTGRADRGVKLCAPAVDRLRSKTDFLLSVRNPNTSDAR